MGVTDVGVVVFEAGGIVSLDTNITGLDSCFQINRFNSEQENFL